MNDFAGAETFAEAADEPLIWTKLGQAQLEAGMIKDAIISFTRANDPSFYKEVVEAIQNNGMLISSDN